jgi:hypothetical protein
VLGFLPLQSQPEINRILILVRALLIEEAGAAIHAESAL